ncbi:MAG TPA: CoA pyrophosphatase, partial [Actinomycetes bacterium]|nr:CoA pyrophosphatase [Actinomycetes bacterium]
MTAPAWMTPLLHSVGSVSAADLTRFPAPPDAEHRSAVLMLLGESDGEPDVLLIERAHDMRSHAGQPAFPGGRVDDGDADVSATALREAEEETGLDPSGVEVVAVLPDLFIPPSGFVVTPVLGWWGHPTPVYVKDPAEVASVHRVPIAELADPARRVRVRHPSGYVGPAFEVRGL